MERSPTQSTWSATVAVTSLIGCLLSIVLHIVLLACACACILFFAAALAGSEIGIRKERERRG